MTALALFDRTRVGSMAALMREIICGPLGAEPTPAPAHEPRLITAREASKALAVCEKTLWALTKAGEIPVIRIGRGIRYDPRDLTAWIDKTKSTSADSSSAF